MRSLVFLLFAATLAGCSGMMMIGGSSGSGTSGTARTTGVQSAADESLTEQIKQLYARDAVLREAGISVTTRQGLVRISGSVPSYGAREKAEKLAISTNGVTGVDNRITVDYLN